MIQDASSIRKFYEKIKDLPRGNVFTKSDLLTNEFRLFKQDSLEIYYAPFDYINPVAKLVLVGITPGWTQMEISYRTLRDGLNHGLSVEDAYAQVKQQASFAGPMRSHLVSMLNQLGIPSKLGIHTAASLFAENRSLVHTTSVVRYPVFVEGDNYQGSRPKLLKTDCLRRYARGVFANELQLIGRAFIVPLGDAVSKVVQELIASKLLDEERCLVGFPHPSGGNGHRVKQFAERRTAMQTSLNSWFSSVG